MPAETTHHVAGPLTVAVGLAATAGYVDAFIFQRVMPVFVANMSGNLIHFGMALGNVEWTAVGMAAIALMSFAAAAFAGATVLDRHVEAGRHPDPTPMLLAEVVLLGAVATIAIAGDVELSTRLDWAHVAIVVLGATAMGLQAVAVRRVGQTAVSTTYGTGSIVRVSEKVALGLRRSARGHDVPRRRSVQVLVSILFAYVAGAVVASALPANRWLLLVAPAVTLVLAGQVRALRAMGASAEPTPS